MPTPDIELYLLDRDLTRDELILELALTPGRLRRLMAGVAPDLLDRRAGGWSAIQVCCHLRDAVQVYGMRFKWMILQDDPFLPNYDEEGWVANSPDSVGTLETLLSEMEAYRGETVRLLRAIPAEGWSRRGHHELLGWVELEAYVRHEVAHEEQHLAQFRELVSATP